MWITHAMLRSGCRLVLPAALLAILLSPDSAFGLDEPTPVRSFRSFDITSHPALPGPAIWKLLQDDRGLLWVAGHTGIATFDGMTFELVEGEEAAPRSGQAHDLQLRPGGGLYVAERRGVSVWDGRRWELLPIEGGAFAVSEDEHGVLWAVGDGGQLLRYERVEQVWTPHRSAPEVGGLVAAASGETWALAGGAAYRLGRRGELLPVAGGHPVPGRLTAVAAGRDLELWVATEDGGLFSAKPRDDRWLPVANIAECGLTFIRALELDHRGRLWIGDNSGRLCFGDETGWTAWDATNGLNDTGILALHFDREDTLWIGFNTLGLQQWVGPQWSHRDRWRDEDSSLAFGAVTDVAGTADGGLLATSMTNGVLRWDGATLHWYGAGQGLHQNSYTVFEPSPGTLWVGARFGLDESRGGSDFQRVLELPTGFVSDFFRSPAGIYYAATTHHGVYRRTGTGWEAAETLNSKLLDPDVRKMVWRANGELWVASRTGVAIIHGSTVRYLRTGGPGMPTTVTDLLVMSPDEVWISGNGGVRILGAHSRFLSEAEGMPGRVVGAMARSPSGEVWLLGTSGVTRLSGQKATRWDGSNGLLNPAGLLGSIWIDPDGDVYVGTMGGLSRYSAEAGERPPPPLKLFWRAGPGTGSTSGDLPQRQRAASWSWLAPSLLPGGTEYRVRLPGIHDDWLQTQTEPRIEIPSLPTGTWRIEVAARRGRGGEWSAPLTASFAVAPRLGETWWVRMSGLAGALALVAGTIRLRTNRLRLRALQLDHQVTVRTEELAHANDKLEVANEELGRLARTDALTGLANRASFDETLLREWDRAARTGQPLALVLGDVDHFKGYNDHYGHPAGDDCLQRIASVLRSSARRPGDLVARYGGEEFVLVLPDTDLKGAIELAEKLLAEVAWANVPHEVSPVASHVTMSLGVATTMPDGSVTATELVETADRALYEAKSRGRNRVHADLLPTGDWVPDESPELSVAWAS
jgi:diguanylate cyclase (GGDEF)-like protein